jgi:uncharacterized membrane protein YoaK (UPF0700 family)
MITFLSEVRQTLLPARDTQHGLLPPMLIGMTAVTGLVDAFSYLVLGHVFVANMTGNVVFLAFGVIGVTGFSIGASLSALIAFALGALGGGVLASRLSDSRERLLSNAATAQSLLLAAALVLAVMSGHPVSNGYRYALIAVLSIAMGLQNAAARKLAVPDLTTTVLTMTITGMASDARALGGSGSSAGRRLTAIAAMLLGAFIGAALILKGQSLGPLCIALTVAAVVAGAARLASRPHETHHP